MKNKFYFCFNCCRTDLGCWREESSARPAKLPLPGELATGSRLGGSSGHYAGTKPTATTRPSAPRDNAGGCALSRGMLEVEDKDFVSPAAAGSEAAPRASAHPRCGQSLPCVSAAAAQAEPRRGASLRGLERNILCQIRNTYPTGFLKAIY